jgi:ribosome maturation factor RimP
VTQRVWELAEPLALTAGLELVDVQYRPEGGRVILRVLLDRSPGGVTLEELTRVSRELGDLVDAHDTVPGRYQLECSSPGLNRPLLREAHYARVVGQRVSVRTREPIAGRRQFHGILEGVQDAVVSVRDPDAGLVQVALAAVEKANLEYDFGRPASGRAARA